MASFWETIASPIGAIAGGSIGSAFGFGGAGALLGGALGSGVSSAAAQRDANEQNIASVREQMAFQERMSNSAYQRATEDMRRAGINPMLAISQGGASTPSGASASVQPVDFNKHVLSAGSAALEARQTHAMTKKVESDTSLNAGVAQIQQAQARKINADADISSAEGEKARLESQYYKDHPYMMTVEKALGPVSSAVGSVGSAAAIAKLLKSSPISKQQDLTKDEKSILDSYNKGRGYKRRMP